MNEEEIQHFKTVIMEIVEEFQKPIWQDSPYAASIVAIIIMLDNLNDRLVKLEGKDD